MTPVLPAPTADELAVMRARIKARHWPRHQLPWGARAQRIPGRRPLWLVTVLLGILTVVVPLVGRALEQPWWAGPTGLLLVPLAVRGVRDRRLLAETSREAVGAPQWLP